MTKQEKIQAEQVAPSIYSAIAAAAGEVKVLGKSEHNKFDGYDFVSIDKFLALVNPICAKNGIFPIISQSSVELYENTNSKGGKTTWARFFYDITLFHSSGQSLGPVNVMVSVPMNGAQATGSAQSYALKQFFRATLMIPTGDKDDADLLPTEAHSATANAPKKRSWAQTITDELPPTATDHDKARAVADALCAQWKRKKTHGELSNEWDRRKGITDQMAEKFPEMFKAVAEAYEARVIELEPMKSPHAAE